MNVESVSVTPWGVDGDESILALCLLRSVWLASVCLKGSSALR
ncbi:hypothetical protein VCRA2122O339_320035 [Vibrio crassostreae]|nr:hypothetical protein VCRA2120E331_310027 [Vibrio crassostreae]CAK3438247.1 hypothetical protein VCRA2127O345_310027 [Vibrio crassostreae]CAK3443390.1 hypothetical protein VCRA2120E330_300027 [Vibrio crassostreae]CAK3471044.1 hypothetical protein VCRA2122O339_320035 [Vibrio crassostreae]CAK3473738.1 hypothetical protein VCRA2122O338_310027 [Vibrio crassostreae]